MPSNLRDPPHPDEKSPEQGSRITEDTGKPADGEMGSAGLVQAGYKTPIKPTSEKCGISGIRGTGCWYTFAVMYGEVASSFFVAREMS